MGVIGVIGVLTLNCMVRWFIGIKRRRGSATLNPPLVEHDQLGGDDNLRNVTVSAKTVPNGTFSISRNTILKH